MSETNLDEALNGESGSVDDIDLGDLDAELGGDESAESGGGLDDIAGDLAAFGDEGEAESAADEAGGGLEDLAGDLGGLGGDATEAGADEGGGGLGDLDLGELGGGDDADAGGSLDDLGGGDAPAASSGGGSDIVAASRAKLNTTEAVNLEFLLDVKLDVTFEVGRAKMMISDLLTLGQGSVVELHRLVGEELDVLVNSKLIAKGEVVVVNEKFGCRITEIVSPEDRIKHLSGY